jgi:hypothetical protein
MIYHRSPHQKPFKVGQLVRLSGDTYNYFCIVLKIRWDEICFEWDAFLHFQDSGRTEWHPTRHFHPAVKNND